MSHYMLLIADDASRELTEADWEESLAAHGKYTQEMVDAGVMRGGEALHPPSTARTVRVRQNQATVTDGPFADTAEALGGYYLIEVETMEEAVAWAKKCPDAATGCIEVREIFPTDQP